MKSMFWVVLVGIITWIGATSTNAIVSPLKTAFNATGAKPGGYSMNIWVQVPTSSQGKTLRSDLSQLANAAHVQGRVQTSQGTGYQKALISTRVNHITTMAIVERLQSGATYYVLDRTSSQQFYGLKASQSLFHHVLAQWGKPHMAMTLQGWLPKNVSSKKYGSLISKAFQAIGATQVNGITTKQYKSIAGHTPLIPQSDMLQGHPVNVQVAVTTNTYRHRTQVDVGSPLITVTY